MTKQQNKWELAAAQVDSGNGLTDAYHRDVERARKDDARDPQRLTILADAEKRMHKGAQ
jgi:hypothetical protein